MLAISCVVLSGVCASWAREVRVKVVLLLSGVVVLGLFGSKKAIRLPELPGEAAR